MKANAPVEHIPVYVPEGSIIPFGPAMEWSDEKQPSLINLYVYAGRNGRFTLYEDEGTNYDYEQGQYATIDFTYDEANHTLTIGSRKGSFSGMLRQRQFRIVVVGKDKATPLNLDSPQGKLVTYNGEQITCKL